MLQALSLYREPIPHDHADRLEEALGVTNAWARLDQRCLLPSDPMQQNFYLHGFIAEWVSKQLDQRALERLHALVAEAWLRDLNGTKRITQPNIQRANEAFHHLLCAQQHQRLEEISINLFGANLDWVCRQLWTYDERLFEQKAPIKSQQQVLTLITRITPADSKAWRFLGESLRITEGPNSAAALACFENAYGLLPSFPQYLANLGEAMIAQGIHGADRFLHLLAQAKQQHPASINDYVVSIEAKALSMTDQAHKASTLRQSQIDQDSRNSAFYNAEAEYQASIGNASGALVLLDLAKQRGCANEYTISMWAEVLQKQGNGAAASTLRQGQIDQGSRHQAFYAAEAEYQASIGNAPGALVLLDRAKQRGCANEYTISVWAEVLKKQGNGAAASILRQGQIDQGSRHQAFYNAEADYQASLGNTPGALALLDLAEQRGCADAYTTSIRAEVLQKQGNGTAASALRQSRINQGSRHQAFYAAEAEYQASIGNASGALTLLDLAEQLGGANAYTTSIRAKIENGLQKI